VRPIAAGLVAVGIQSQTGRDRLEHPHEWCSPTWRVMLAGAATQPSIHDPETDVAFIVATLAPRRIRRR